MTLRSCCSAPARREAIFTDERKRGFLIHLFVYLAVNVPLIVVNLLTTPDYYWVPPSASGVGLGPCRPCLRHFLSRAAEAPDPPPEQE
jgi:2TM domain